MPITLTIFNRIPKVIDIQEYRKLSEIPVLSQIPVTSWPGTLDTFFKDHLAFRSYFVGMYGRIWEKFLGASVLRSWTGKNGEQFPNISLQMYKDALGMTAIPKERLIMTKLSYAGMQAFFELHNIKYYIFMAPDKHTLYPEWLPFWAQWRRGASIYDQLYKNLHINRLNFYSILQPLAAHKYNKKLYNTYFDTVHWNGNALEIAYSHILNTLLYDKKSVHRYYKYNLINTYNIVYGNEKVPFLDISTQGLKDESKKVDFISAPAGLKWAKAKLFLNPSNNYHTLWFASDSYFQTHKNPWGFFTPLAHYVHKYLHLHYGCLTLPLAERLFAQHKPDVVIEAFVERTSGNPQRAHDPRIRILGDVLLETPAHILTPTALRSSGKIYNALISENSGAASLQALNHDPIINLPPLVTDADGRGVIMARLIAPAATTAKVYYAPSGSQFSENFSVAAPVKKGENLLHIQFFGKPWEQLQTRFDPGELPGAYQFLPIPDVDALKEKHHGL